MRREASEVALRLHDEAHQQAEQHVETVEAGRREEDRRVRVVGPAEREVAVLERLVDEERGAHEERDRQRNAHDRQPAAAVRPFGHDDRDAAAEQQHREDRDAPEGRRFDAALRPSSRPRPQEEVRREQPGEEGRLGGDHAHDAPPADRPSRRAF